ncbi:MAG: hypothetical protein C3F17_20475, partial [Bradyrhizobiaceae bacterium]
MLPDLRAIAAAVLATLGLLMVGFGAVSALRVSQDRTLSPLQEARERMRTNPFATAPPVPEPPA